ncbi:hypothetical protein [Marilutibacter maris]|uniref:hypothetical protein n=1 Tax=Marilutibacter maris TaxID=1605891 RepID=UPI0011AE2657|nr:hypothetical protein [Lysobacter maris]
MKAMDSIKSVRILAVAFVAFLMVGCELDVPIISASARQVGDDEVIEVDISSRYASRIKSRQYYFYVLVVDCKEGGEVFAMDPYVGGKRAVEFDYDIDGEVTKIVGAMPAEVFAAYSDPCAAIEGGGYFSGRLRSTRFPLRTAVGDKKN